MDVSETIWWVLRIIVTLIVTLVLALILTVMLPPVDDPNIRADLLGARIAYGGGFMDGDGTIDSQKFTQQVADASLQYPEDTLNPGAGARVWVADRQGATILEPIYYHKDAYDVRSTFYRSGGAGTHRKYWSVPVSVDGTREGVLHMEVLYAG